MNPPIYSAVRAIGVLKPKFQNQQPGGPVFADSLDVRGTAFWLKNEKVLITCAHVIQGLVEAPLEISGLLVVGNQGNYQRATIGAVDFTHDLAVLHLLAAQQLVDSESCSGLEIGTHYPGVGTRVGYSGFPLGQQLLTTSSHPTYAVGVIGAQMRHSGSRKDIQISGPVVGGYSGSPIVQESDPTKVIGVVSNSPSVEAGQAGIFMATSWEHIIALSRLAIS
jgi:hypothetical protein